MAHFAELDSNNIALRVLVVDNSIIQDAQGNENEQQGIVFLKSLFGQNTIWIQTSYNAKIRKNFASIGFSYDVTRDAFIAPKPDAEGWLFDEDSCNWFDPNFKPIEMPEIGVSRI